MPDPNLIDQKNLKVSVPFRMLTGQPVKFGKLTVTLALMTAFSAALASNESVVKINATLVPVDLLAPEGDAFVARFSGLPDGRYSATAQSFDELGNLVGVAQTDYCDLGSTSPIDDQKPKPDDGDDAGGIVPPPALNNIPVPVGVFRFEQF